MPSELEEINHIFKNRGMLFSIEWLESCLEWCKHGNLPPNYNVKTLERMVLEQWMLLDLRDVEISSLPRNLSMEKKYSLAGVYYLQLMQVIDISKPKLWQLQRIRNKVSKNSEVEKDFGKRVLQLTLTDGVQEVQAMEFKPIVCLNLNLIPGVKIKIMGPVMVRNGRLMLEPDNVEILGGSVDDLIIKYAAENVLARALGLEENPNPHIIDEKILDVTEANQRDISNQFTQNQPRNNLLVNSKVNAHNQANKNQETPHEFQVDAELLQELEEDFEDTSVNDFKKSTTSGKPNAQSMICTSPDLFEVEFDDEFLNEHLDQIARAENTTKKFDSRMNDNLTGLSNKQDVPRSSSKSNIKPKHDDEVITLDDSFDDIDIDSHLDNIDKEMANLPCSTQKPNSFKSPVLKRPSSTPKLSVSKPVALKKLTQSKLTFGSSNKANPVVSDDDDDFENPFSPFGKFSQNRPPGFVPLDMPKKAPNKSKVSLSEGNSRAGPSGISSDFKQPSCSPVLPKLNIISIGKLKKMLPNVSKGKFKIKAKFKIVAEKLRTTSKTFFLALTVTDDTGELTVEVHSDIVANFAQITPEQLTNLRELVIDHDREARSVIYDALKRLNTKCKALDNVLELQVTRGDKLPLVINVIVETL